MDKKINSLSKNEKLILKISATKWFNNPAGISALDFEKELNLKNIEIMKIMESLVDKGLGSLNRNVTLYCIHLDIDNPSSVTNGEEVETHIFFPSKEILKYYFFRSKHAKEEIPEYTKRLYLGECQVGLVLFNEEVLRKYFDHPEYYDIDDSMAGGRVSTNGQVEEDEYIYVRYGKKLINDGYTAITAIYSDLAAMSPNEQKYWSSFEIKECRLDGNDKNFKVFLSRSFDGEWVEYPDPITHITELLKSFNKLIPTSPLFIRTSNIHLRPPVENTKKAFSNSCSELYKLIGPDNVNSKSLKNLLQKHLGLTDEDFIHKPSKKNLSISQLIKVLNKAVCNNTSFYEIIDVIKGFRIEADHTILEKEDTKKNYTNHFYDVCNNYYENGAKLVEKIETIVQSNC